GHDSIDYPEAAAVLWTLRRAGVSGDDPIFARLAATLDARKPKSLEEAALLLLGKSAQPLPEGDPFAIEDTTKSKDVVAPSKQDMAVVEATARLIISKQVPDTTILKAGGREFDASGGWWFDLDGPLAGIDAEVPSTYLALLS